MVLWNPREMPLEKRFINAQNVHLQYTHPDIFNELISTEQ